MGHVQIVLSYEVFPILTLISLIFRLVLTYHSPVERMKCYKFYSGFFESRIRQSAFPCLYASASSISHDVRMSTSDFDSSHNKIPRSSVSNISVHSLMTDCGLAFINLVVVISEIFADQGVKFQRTLDGWNVPSGRQMPASVNEHDISEII